MASAIHTTVALFCCLMIGSCYSQKISSNYFEESDLYDVNERKDKGCFSKIPKSRSRLECYSLCERDTSCIGASLGTKGLCFHHKECPMLSGQRNTQLHEHRFMTKYCAHGTWNMTVGSCQCVDGFFGDRCKQCSQQCRDLLNRGYPKGRHAVYTDPSHNGQKPFLTQCFVNPSSSYASVLVFSNTGVQDFNKTWTDYVHGFYIDAQNYWLGLYALYRSCPCKELVFAFEFETGSKYVYRIYYEVTVSDERSGYSFTFSDSSNQDMGNAPNGVNFGPCLEPLKNLRFSTWDSDNDENADRNCAANAGSGWWYKGCDNPCNALGLGLKHLNKISRKRIVSLLGVDTDSLDPEEGIRFYMYVLP